MKKMIGLAAAALLAACGGSSKNETPAPPAPGPTRLYGTTVPNPNSALYELSPTTGELVRFIGTVAYGVNGLDWDSRTGRLLATTTSWDPHAPSVLLQIDPATADATVLGTTSPENLVNLAASSAGKLFSWTESSDDLVSLSATGVATVIADSGINSATHSLKFDARDRLWFVNYDTEVFVMDSVTGLGSTVGNLGSVAHHGDFHPDTGRFWGIDATSNPRNFAVGTLDPLVLVTVIPAPNDIHAIAFRK